MIHYYKRLLQPFYFQCSSRKSYSVVETKLKEKALSALTRSMSSAAKGNSYEALPIVDKYLPTLKVPYLP